jgi:glycosyltransferase involved in cell wall biosynthesis
MQIKEEVKVSILMNCRDGERYVKQAIDSVYAQTYQNFEIIFIDNHSKDKSAKIAKSYDERVRYFLTPEPISLFSARNYGLEQCSGACFCVLDADDYWAKDKLEIQIKKFHESPNVSFVYTNANLLYEGKKFKTMLINLILSFKSFFKFSGERTLKDLVTNYNINFQTVMIKMELAKATKFNGQLNYIGDCDFHYRLIINFLIRPYYINRVLSTTRLHNMQVTVQTPEKWMKETKFVLIKTLKQLAGKDIAQYFLKELARKKFVYFLNKSEPAKAFRAIKRYMPNDIYLSLLIAKKIVFYFIKSLSTRA